jgi:hypothetical protein
VWFYTGLASLLLGNHLVTPYFSKPVDAISYAVASAAAMLGAEELSKWSATEAAIFYLVLGYSAFVLLLSFIAIFLRGAQGLGSRFSQSSAYLAAIFGNHRAVFGLTMLSAAYLFHRDSVSQTFLICLVCIICVVTRPDEVLTALVGQMRKIWGDIFVPTPLGYVAAVQTPNVYLIRQAEDTPTEFGTAVVIKLPDKAAFPAVALDTVGRDEAVLIRCVDANAFLHATPAVDKEFQSLPDETAGIVPAKSNMATSMAQHIATCRNRLVGLVANDTSNERLYFEVVTAQDLQQGLLVQVQCQNSTVIYQILDGLTKEEVVHQKNTYGTVRGQAKKIGIWDAASAKFVPSKWLPRINEPVLLAATAKSEGDANTIGKFPGGAYPVQLANIDHLVTHNTAILGILGVGKSMLALELVERMVARGIKVICLDLTDQYEIELADFFDGPSEAQERNNLYSFGSIGKTKFNATIELGGSVKEIRKELHRLISAFLKNDAQKIKILNPARFDVWKQMTNQFRPTDIPGMAQLTACQMTQIISEVTLECAQESGMSSGAKVCVVYEEAHSLVPEWNSVAFEGDKSATAGTARAILQGRKYGMGCLLITQRTANVTKTILNQCNSIFAMRTFDDTGKEFLSNYVGRDYADTLSNLPERHAVFFGRASSCENPVLIELNNRDEFKKSFREKFPRSVSVEIPAELSSAPQVEIKN